MGRLFRHVCVTVIKQYILVLAKVRWQCMAKLVVFAPTGSRLWCGRWGRLYCAVKMNLYQCIGIIWWALWYGQAAEKGHGVKGRRFAAASKLITNQVKSQLPVYRCVYYGTNVASCRETAVDPCQLLPRPRRFMFMFPWAVESSPLQFLALA